MELAARLNHGRWLVDCRACPGAGLLNRLEPDGRFRCPDCGAGPHAVVVPDDRDAIEDAVAPREISNRNWRPGETVEDLIAANVEHGVA